MAVKATGTPTRTLPVGVRAAVTVGLLLAPGVTTTSSVRVALPPLPSVTVTLAL